MIRNLLLIAVPLTILFGMPVVGLADDGGAWPYYEVEDNFRGSGQYFSWWRLAMVWLIFLAWVKSTDWVQQDAREVHARVKLWTPIVVGTFGAALALIWLLSSFKIGYSALMIAYVAPLGTYIVVRNRGVEPDQRVLTPSHLGEWLGDRLSSLGLGRRESEDATRTHAIRLHARCADTHSANDAISQGVLTLPGYEVACDLIGDVLENRAQALMIDVQADGVALRYLIDGVWHNADSRTKEDVAPIVDVIRSICTGDPTGQRATARGLFDFEIIEKDYVCQVTQQTSEGVYRIVLKIDEPHCSFTSLEELGMHPKMADRLRELLSQKNHMIVLSSLPGAGLSTTIDTILETTDRIRKDCAVVESAQKYEREVDATDVHKYSAELEPAKLLAKVVQSWPDLLIARDTPDTETARLLCRQAREDGVVVTSIAAKSGIEALLRVLMLKVPAKEFAPVVSAVVYQRLIRRLCDACKVAYQPSDNLLQQLGLPAGRVEALYRPPQPSEEVCQECSGLGYRGRTALFEMLTIDDAIRELLTSKPSLDGLRTLAHQKGMHSIRDFGAVMVARGDTSVEELSRTLKQ